MKTISCRLCDKEFAVTPADEAFYAAVGHAVAGTLHAVSTSSLCPTCRNRRRMSWRNERCLYKRECDFSKKNIISLYAPNTPYKVYSADIWWSDKWNPLDYGRNMDFTRPFFEQFHALNTATPKLSLINDNNVQSENCEYTTDFSFGKDCYYVFSTWHAEDLLYATFCNRTNHSCDMAYSQECANMYEGVDCHLCSDARYLTNCVSTSFSAFCYDLKNCSHCLFCYGLRGKQYCVENKEVGKEAYEAAIASLQLHTRSGMEHAREHFEKIILQAPRRALNQKNCEQCEGDYLRNCRNIYAFDIFDSEDSQYLFRGETIKHCYDLETSGQCQYCYECITCDNSHGCLGTVFSWKNSNVAYAVDCHGSQDLFGCVSLRNARYCILNKQYTKEEYEALVPRIIEHMKATGEWGEFFPLGFSPFAYNESLAMEYHPLSQEDATSFGSSWREINARQQITQTTPLPNNIDDVSQEITNQILACNHCERNYKIIPRELAFYLEKRIPVPSTCPECRHLSRSMHRRNPRKMFERHCDQCGTSIHTTYAPTRPEKVLCDTCYFHRIG